MKHSFKPKKGLHRVEVGNLEIGPAGHQTDDPHLIAELSANPFLVRNEKQAAKPAARKPRAKPAVAPAETTGETS